MPHTDTPQKKTSIELALEGLKMKFWKRPSIFEDCYCSVYPNITSITNPLKAPILDILTNSNYQDKDLITKIRTLKTKKERDPLKRRLKSATISSIQGMSGNRGESNHIKHSGFIQFDIDKMYPEDIEVVKYKVMVLPYTAYISRSASGNGLWGLIKVSSDCDSSNDHDSYWNAMQKYLDDVLSDHLDTEKNQPLTIDTAPSSVASVRYIVCDTDAYINHQAEIFTDRLERIIKVKKVVTPSPISTGFNDPVDPSTKLTAAEKISLWNGSVSFDTIHNILIDAGYIYNNTKGEKVRYTRPGKDSGISADYHTEKRTFHIFSSEAPSFHKFKETTMGRSGSPLDILLYYKVNGNWPDAFKEIDQEFGLK